MVKRIFQIKDIATALAVTTTTVEQDIKAGRLNGTKVGNQYTFTFRDLERYLGAGKAQSLFGNKQHKIQEVRVESHKSTVGRDKRCAECDQIRPVYEFDRDASQSDWLSPICRTCKRLKEGRTWPDK